MDRVGAIFMLAKPDRSAEAALTKHRGARQRIEALIESVERTDAKVSLVGASLDIKTPAFSNAKPHIPELKERPLEAVGYRAGKRMPAALPASKAFPRTRLMPLSMAQEALAHVERVPVQDQWVPFLWRMRGPFDMAAFNTAYTSMIERQEILRTRY